MVIYVVKKCSMESPAGTEVYRDVSKDRCLKKAAILASKEVKPYSGEIWRKDDKFVAWDGNFRKTVVFEVRYETSIEDTTPSSK